MNYRTCLFELRGLASLLVVLLLTPVFAQDFQVDAEWLEAVRASHEGTVVNVSIASHPASEALKEMSEEFTELTGIEFVWDVAAETGGGLKNKQLSNFTVGGNYDILMVDTFWVSEYVEKGILAPLDDFLGDSSLTPSWFDAEDFNAGFASMAIRNDTTYALPIAGSTRLVAYRSDLFEEHSISVPTTLDELLEVARFFKDEVAGIDGMTMRAAQGIQFASAWLQLIYQFGGGFVDQQTLEVTIDDEPTIESLEYFIELLKTGPVGIETFGFEESAAAFSTGGAALWYDGTPIVLTRLENPESSQVVGKIGYFAPPAGPAGAFAPLAGWLMGLSSSAPNSEAAWSFLMWANSRANAKAYYELSGQVNRDSLFEDPSVTEGFEGFYAAYQESLNQAANLAAEGLTWIPPVPSDVLVIAGDFGNRALLGQLDATDAMGRAAVEIERVLNQ